MNRREYYRCLCGIAALTTASCLTGGCSALYTFKITGVVRSVSDGTPLPGVEIEYFNRWGEDAKNQPVVTGSDGKFAFTFEAINSEAEGPWQLKLSKQSYQTEEVEVSIDARGLSPKVPMYIHIVTYLCPE